MKNIIGDKISLKTPYLDSYIELFNPFYTKPIHSEDDDSYSIDVLIIDENGINGVAFYDYGSMEWRFHTDTLVDYDEKDHETKWMWYYPPFKAKDIFHKIK